jgi:hypothetical protein
MNPIDSNAGYPLARQPTRNKDNAGGESARTGGQGRRILDESVWLSLLNPAVSVGNETTTVTYRIIEPQHEGNQGEIICIERLGGQLKSYHRKAA